MITKIYRIDYIQDLDAQPEPWWWNRFYHSATGVQIDETATSGYQRITRRTGVTPAVTEGAYVLQFGTALSANGYTMLTGSTGDFFYVPFGTAWGVVGACRLDNLTGQKPYTADGVVNSTVWRNVSARASISANTLTAEVSMGRLAGSESADLTYTFALDAVGTWAEFERQVVASGGVNGSWGAPGASWGAFFTGGTSGGYSSDDRLPRVWGGGYKTNMHFQRDSNTLSWTETANGETNSTSFPAVLSVYNVYTRSFSGDGWSGTYTCAVPDGYAILASSDTLSITMDLDSTGSGTPPDTIGVTWTLDATSYPPERTLQTGDKALISDGTTQYAVSKELTLSLTGLTVVSALTATGAYGENFDTSEYAMSDFPFWWTATRNPYETMAGTWTHTSSVHVTTSKTDLQKAFFGDDGTYLGYSGIGHRAAVRLHIVSTNTRLSDSEPYSVLTELPCQLLITGDKVYIGYWPWPPGGNIFAIPESYTWVRLFEATIPTGGSLASLTNTLTAGAWAAEFGVPYICIGNGGTLTLT